MQEMRDRLIHLSRCRGIGRRTIRRMLQHDPTLKQVYYLSSSYISQLYGIPHKKAKTFYSDLHNSHLMQQITSEPCTIITIVDENYPNVLKTIKDAPLVLYARGNTALLDRMPALSVIGTRNPSPEALPKTERILGPLINSGWTIISGMAKGVDSHAHQCTLSGRGKTIAVLGGGFGHIYPKQNISLFQQISEQGLVLSEYAASVPPQKHHFPERNRIISGLSFGTLVIEAKERSGTLITVDQALDQGREVFAVPGSPLIPQTKGNHRMIQDGAKLVLEAEDIQDEWETAGKYLMQVNRQ
nr:DNA-processing protein DprA [Lentibacillus sediminis]